MTTMTDTRYDDIAAAAIELTQRRIPAEQLRRPLSDAQALDEIAAILRGYDGRWSDGAIEYITAALVSTGRVLADDEDGWG